MAERPHPIPHETVWHFEGKANGERWFAIDGASGEVTRYGQSKQACRDEELRGLLERYGFELLAIEPSLLGEPDPDQRDLQALVAHKRA